MKYVGMSCQRPPPLPCGSRIRGSVCRASPRAPFGSHLGGSYLLRIAMCPLCGLILRFRLSPSVRFIPFGSLRSAVFALPPVKYLRYRPTAKQTDREAHQQQ
jgi:hypothetical protein